MNFQILILQCFALLHSVFDVTAYCYNVVAVTDQSNTLQSPGYPNKYFENENCTWTLIAPENYRIELQFILPFDIPDSNDYVTVFEGDNLYGTKIAHFWGSSLPPNVYSIGNNMTVQFRTDKHWMYQGFSASFKTVKQPDFVSKPSDVEVARDSDQSINMTCRVTGSPTPKINWTRDGVEVVTDGDRIIIQPEGDLEITNVTYSDRGTYKCLATNVLGVIEATAMLTVRNRTIIKRDYPWSPVHKFAADGSPVHINCTLIEYDKMLNVSVEWMREDERINASSDNRITIINDKKGHRIISTKLTIRNVTVEDASRYYCVARTRMDEDSDYVQLVVISKPNPPHVTKVQCYAKEAEVSWQSTAGAPASDFIIQYNTNFAPDVWETAIENISATTEDYNVVRVPLRPWQNYTFRVLAHNEGGFSDPSKRFPVTCTTPDDVPRKHPENVSALRKKPASLVITWTPLSLIDHQGPQLYYEVWWKPNNPNSIWQSVELMDWSEGEYVVDVERVPQEYVVFVLAGNVNGVAVQQAQRVYAYTGVATTVSRSDYKAQRAAARLNGSSV